MAGQNPRGRSARLPRAAFRPVLVILSSLLVLQLFVALGVLTSANAAGLPSGQSNLGDNSPQVKKKTSTPTMVATSTISPVVTSNSLLSSTATTTYIPTVTVSATASSTST